MLPYRVIESNKHNEPVSCVLNVTKSLHISSVVKKNCFEVNECRNNNLIITRNVHDIFA